MHLRPPLRGDPGPPKLFLCWHKDHVSKLKGRLAVDAIIKVKKRSTYIFKIYTKDRKICLKARSTLDMRMWLTELERACKIQRGDLVGLEENLETVAESEGEGEENESAKEEELSDDDTLSELESEEDQLPVVGTLKKRPVVPLTLPESLSPPNSDAESDEETKKEPPTGEQVEQMSIRELRTEFLKFYSQEELSKCTEKSDLKNALLDLLPLPPPPRKDQPDSPRRSPKGGFSGSVIKESIIREASFKAEKEKEKSNEIIPNPVKEKDPDKVKLEASSADKQDPTARVERKDSENNSVTRNDLAEQHMRGTRSVLLASKSVRILKQQCESENLDTSTCFEKRDLVDLLNTQDDVAVSVADKEAEIRALLATAMVMAEDGEFNEATGFLEKASREANQVGNKTLEAHAMCALAGCFQDIPEKKPAVPLMYEMASQMYEDAGEASCQKTAMVDAATSHWDLAFIKGTDSGLVLVHLGNALRCFTHYQQLLLDAGEPVMFAEKVRKIRDQISQVQTDGSLTQPTKPKTWYSGWSSSSK